MKSPERGKVNRRRFLTTVSAAASMSFLNTAGMKEILAGDQTSEMPSMAFGPHRISRLVCGSNTINGNSYMGQHTDRYMRAYFTPERTVEFLKQCERAGITAHQVSMHERSAEYLRLLREQGTKIQMISVSNSDRESIEDVIRIAQPIAIVHHGGVTDRFFAQNKSQLVKDYVKAVKDKGVLAGVSAHNPDCIKQIADEGWDVDFFTPCFYYLTSTRAKKDGTLPVLDVYAHPFFRDDPYEMIKVIKQVEQPCLAFKILAGGRLCSDQKTVRAAFKFAFENIKPVDGVMVGMFPWYFDEVSANATYTRETSKL